MPEPAPHRTTITRRFDRLRADEKSSYRSCLDALQRAGKITNFGCLYVIDQINDSQPFVKTGATTLKRIGDRATEIQTGSPYSQRVVSLCLFYDRGIAIRVESALKSHYAGSRSQGGTEWFNVSRSQVMRDIWRICHDLARNQILANANEIPFIDPALSTNFYGLLTFDIVDGQIRHYEELEATSCVEMNSAPPEASKQRDWLSLRSLIRNLCGW